MKILTTSLKGDPIIEDLYRFSILLGCFCGGVVL